MRKHAVGRSPETQAMTHFIGRPFCRATVPGSSRPAPAASRLQFAPPVGLLARIREGVQDFPVFLDELDPCQVRPRRRRNVLPGSFTPQHLPQQLVKAPVVALGEEALPGDAEKSRV